jgi:CBS-domain-containing membrane protein
MTKDVVSVAPGDSLESVATKLGAQGLHRLLVVDSGEILRGIIAWSDVAPHLLDQTVGQFVAEAAQQPQGTDRG